MADQKITELTALGAAPETTDVIPMVDDPGGSPATKKVTVANLLSVNDALTFKVRATPGDEDLDADGGEVGFTDWDLQSIVGESATMVVLRVRVYDDTVGSYIAFRENGSSDGTIGLGLTIVRVQVANQVLCQDVIVKCDSSQVIEYSTTDQGGSAIGEARATVIGWWEPIA